MVFDPLHSFPGYALRRASNASLSDLTDMLSKYELRVTEATTLVVVSENPGITQSELGKLLGVASANIAPLIGRLDKRGLILRIRLDGRSHGLELSHKGQELAQHALSSMKEHETTIFQKIPEPLHANFLEALKHLWTPN